MPNIFYYEKKLGFLKLTTKKISKKEKKKLNLIWDENKGTGVRVTSVTR